VRRDDRVSLTRRASQCDSALARLVAIAGCVLAGCRGGAPSTSQTQPGQAAGRRDIQAGGALLPLAHASAFELVATSAGAVLVWAPPGACRTGLRARRLAADGSMSEPAVVLSAACGGADADADVMELTAAAGGGRLGVVLIAEDKVQREARVLGTQAADSAHAFAPVVQLGAAEPTGRAERGRVELVAAEGGQLRVAWHAPRTACVGESGSCAQLLSEPYPPAAEAAGRRTDTREIPQPCPRLLMGAIWTDGVWYDAFCALAAAGAADYDVAGTRFTHVYAIRPEISYAEVDPTLQDCEPLGLAPSRTGAIAWGRCADGLRAHMFAPEGRRQTVSGITRSVECAAGRPVLRLRGASGSGATFPLDAPRDRLELWLPPELASQDSRAAFTGRHLLVATPQAGGLVVHSHHCDTQGLVSVVSDARPML
jgi:hypothetical protein